MAAREAAKTTDPDKKAELISVAQKLVAKAGKEAITKTARMHMVGHMREIVKNLENIAKQDVTPALRQEVQRFNSLVEKIVEATKKRSASQIKSKQIERE